MMLLPMVLQRRVAAAHAALAQKKKIPCLHPLEPERDDTVLAPIEYDIVSLVALAFDSQYKHSRRRSVDRAYQDVTTFWRWWLDEAVPSAWLTVPEPPTLSA
jgi:hypothetical protein